MVTHGRCDRRNEFLIYLTQFTCEFFEIVLEKGNSSVDFINLWQLTDLYEFICEKYANQLHTSFSHLHFYNCLVVYLIINEFDCFIRGSIEDPYRMNFYGVYYKIDKLEILSDKIDNRNWFKSVNVIQTLDKLYSLCNEELKNQKFKNFNDFSINEKKVPFIKLLKRKDSELKKIPQEKN